MTTATTRHLPRFTRSQRPETYARLHDRLAVLSASVARAEAAVAGHVQALAERDGRIAFLEARLAEATAALRPAPTAAVRVSP